MNTHKRHRERERSGELLGGDGSGWHLQQFFNKYLSII
jgi:hypothetical protein